MFKVLCLREDGEIGRNEVGVFWTENRINALVVHIRLGILYSDSNLRYYPKINHKLDEQLST